MDKAKDVYRKESRNGVVIVTRHQYAGRGRIAARTWFDTPDQSLMMTLVLARDTMTFPLQQLPLRSGVAIASFLGEEYHLEVKIKWPNDILVHGKKISGILCESSGNAVYVGIGLNCCQNSFSYVDHQHSSREPTSIVMEGREAAEPLDLLQGLLVSLSETFRDNHWKRYLEDHLYLRNCPVAFLPGEAYERRECVSESDWVFGVVTGVDDQGGIIIEQKGWSQSWYSGELKEYPAKEEGGDG